MRENRVVLGRMITAFASVIFLCGVMNFGQVWADNPPAAAAPAYASPGGDAMKHCADPNDPFTKAAGGDPNICLQNACKVLGCNSGTSNTCDGQIPAFIKAMNDFTGSCVTPPSSKTSGSDTAGESCISAALKCEQKAKDDISSIDDKATYTKMPKDAPAGYAAQDAQLANCPAIAAAKLEKLETQWNDKQKAVDDLRQKLDDAQEKANGLQTKISTAYSKYQTATSACKQQLQKDEAKLKQETNDDQNKAMEKYNSLNDQITELNESTSQAYEKAREATRQEDVNCQNNAIQALQAYLKDRNSKIAASVLTAGSQNQLFSEVGQTRQQKNGDFAFMYYQYCMTHDPHTSAVKNIQGQLKLALQSIGNRIKSAQTNQKMIMQQSFGQQATQQMQDQVKQITGDDQQCLQQAQTEMQNTVADAQAQLQPLLGNTTGNSCATPTMKANSARTGFSDPSNSLCAAQALGNKKNSKASQGGTDGEIGYYTTELKEAQSEFDAVDALYHTAQASGGGVANGDDAAKFLPNYRTYISDASTLFTTCKCICMPDPTNNNKVIIDPSSDSNCKTAYNALSAAKQAPQCAGASSSGGGSSSGITITPPGGSKQ